MSAGSARSKWQAIWIELPDNVQGAFWMLLGSFLFSSMGLGIKYVGADMDSFQISFFRATFGLLAITPFVLYKGVGSLKTKRIGMHLVRSCIGITAMLSVFYAITHLPLADAVALTFSRPLFLIILAVLFLGEKVRWRRWMATLVGFAGVVVMVQANTDLGFASAVGLFGAFMVALVSVFLKKLSVTEAPVTMLFYFGVIGSLISLVPASFVWQTPTWEQIGILLAASAVGSAGNFCMIRAFAVGEATAVSPFDYTRLIFSGALAYFVFGEVPTLGMVAGAGIIVFSTLYIVHREALARRAKAG